MCVSTMGIFLLSSLGPGLTERVLHCGRTVLHCGSVVRCACPQWGSSFSRTSAPDSQTQCCLVGDCVALWEDCVALWECC